MEKILERFNKIMNISFVFVLIDVVIGLLFINFADKSLVMFTTILGGFILIHGLFSLIKYFYDGLANTIFKTEIFNGIVDVLVGLFAIFFPTKTTIVMGICLAIWLICIGLIKLYFSIVLMKNEEEIYPLTTFIAILIIAMGVVTIFNPFSSFMLLTKLVGIFILCQGLFEGIYISLLKKRAKYVLKVFEE